MSQNKLENFGPVALTTTLTTNIIAPAAAGASAVGYTATADYIILTRIRVVNKTAAPHNFSLYKGATGANAAGTEFMGIANNVPANSYVEWFGRKRLEGANGFLVGGADANTALTFEADGEIGKV